MKITALFSATTIALTGAAGWAASGVAPQTTKPSAAAITDVTVVPMDTDRLIPGQTEERLDPALFARIHRSAIVNVTMIKEMRPLFNGDQAVVLRSGVTLTMSRTFRERVVSLIR